MPTTIRARSRVAGLWFASVMAFVSFWLASCDSDPAGLVLSVKPFYTDADLESDSGLVGSWTDAEDDITFTFEPAEGQQYKLIVKETDDGKTSSAEFEVHLLRFGGDWFLDFLPKPVQSAGGSFYEMHLLRGHSLARILLTRDTLRLSFFEAAWLQKKIDADPSDISYQKMEGALLLTGTSDEVRDLAGLAAHDTGGFSDEITFNRQEDQP